MYINMFICVCRGHSSFNHCPVWGCWLWRSSCSTRASTSPRKPSFKKSVFNTFQQKTSRLSFIAVVSMTAATKFAESSAIVVRSSCYCLGDNHDKVLIFSTEKEN